MDDRKNRIIEELKAKGIDPLKLERELVMLLRKESSSIRVREYLKKILEGDSR